MAAPTWISLVHKVIPLLKFIYVCEVILCSALILVLYHNTSSEFSSIVRLAEVSPGKTLVLSVVCLLILRQCKSRVDEPKFERLLFGVLKGSLWVSLPLVFVALRFWLEGGKHFTAVPDAAYLADSIFKLGSPLTFYLIDSKIFLHLLYDLDFTNVYWGWLQFAMVPILFVLQLAVYAVGLALIMVELGLQKSNSVQRR